MSGSKSVVVPPVGFETKPKGNADHFKQGKDGKWYKYADLPKANAIFIEKHLASDPKLQELKKAMNAPRKKIAPRKNTSKADSGSKTPLRRSKRQQKAPAERPDGLKEEELLDNPKPKRQKKAQRKQDAKNSLTPTQREQLKHLPENWLEDLNTYLVEELDNSKQNVRNVIRQVSRLSSGEGITYHYWPEGVTFYKGKRVDLSWDFDSLYNEAWEFQNEHGQDLGNGWLMLHPIRKLSLFQEYCHKKGMYQEKVSK